MLFSRREDPISLSQVKKGPMRADKTLETKALMANFKHQVNFLTN